MKMRLLIAILVMILVSSGAMASAETQKTPPVAPTLLLKRYQPTHPEVLLMIFNRMAKTQPDFLSWARKSPFLKTAKEQDASIIINRENNRLLKEFAMLDMTEPMVVHTKINLSDYSTLQGKLHINEFTPKTYFSYSIYDENIAIIPKGITDFTDIKISAAEMETILSKARSNGVEVEFLLKPDVADARAPFKMGGQDYWLLLANIGEIRFWSTGDEPQLLWMYRAEWYKPKEDKALMDLKSGGF